VVYLGSGEKAERIRCAKCGFENLPNASFCSGCGARLKLPQVELVRGRFEALTLLLVVGSIYLAVSLIVNVIYQVAIFAILSVISIVLGLCTAYEFYRGKFRRLTIFLSSLSMALGFAVTFIIFLIGLNIRGVFGPGWIIFVAAAWGLWRAIKG
jgi:ABC-type glycerol-3-phosphate transport system permease component